jgi:hypothetical protein
MPGHLWRGRAALALAIAACVLAWPALARPQDEAKIALPLLDLVLFVEERGRSGKRAAEIPLPRSIPIDSSGRVPVVIAVTAVTPANLDQLRALNAVVQTHDAPSGVVQALVPLRRVKDVARRPWVRSIRFPGAGG